MAFTIDPAQWGGFIGDIIGGMLLGGIKITLWVFELILKTVGAEKALFFFMGSIFISALTSAIVKVKNGILKWILLILLAGIVLSALAVYFNLFDWGTPALNGGNEWTPIE